MTRYSLLLLLLVGCGRAKEVKPVEVAPVGHHWEERQKSLVKWQVLEGCQPAAGVHRVCSGVSLQEARMDKKDVPDFFKRVIAVDGFDITVRTVSERRLVHDDWEDVK
jgi:hypothetical protein